MVIYVCWWMSFISLSMIYIFSGDEIVSSWIFNNLKIIASTNFKCLLHSCVNILGYLFTWSFVSISIRSLTSVDIRDKHFIQEKSILYISRYLKHDNCRDCHQSSHFILSLSYCFDFILQWYSKYTLFDSHIFSPFSFCHYSLLLRMLLSLYLSYILCIFIPFRDEHRSEILAKFSVLTRRKIGGLPLASWEVGTIPNYLVD